MRRENLNRCKEGTNDQSWSPSRAVMSMACRDTTPIIDSAVRMNSTLYDLFFSISIYKFSLVHVRVLSSPSVQVVFVARSAARHRQDGLSFTIAVSKQERGPQHSDAVGLLVQSSQSMTSLQPLSDGCPEQ